MLKPSTKLYLLVFVLSAIIIGIGVYGIIQMSTMKKDTQTLYADRILPLAQLGEIRYLNSNIYATIQQVNDHKIPLASALEKMDQSQNKIRENWNAYERTYQTGQEAKFAKQTDILLNQIFSKLTDLKIASSAANYQVADKLLNDIAGDIAQTDNSLNQLLHIQTNISSGIYHDNQSDYDATLKKLLLVITLSLLFAIIFSFSIVKNIQNLIQNLFESKLDVNKSEEKYRYLFQNNPTCIIIWDLETLKVLEVNDEVLKTYGYSKEEWEQMSVLDYRPQEHLEGIKKFAQDMLNGLKITQRRSWTHLKKNGDSMQMEIFSHKIEYEGHKAVLSLGRDITEQVKTESQLLKSEEKYRTLIEHAGDAIFQVSVDNIILSVNKSACEMLGYTREELQGMKSIEVYPSDERINPVDWNRLKKQTTLLNETCLQHKNGNKIDVEVNRKLLEDGKSYIAIVRDVTERNKIRKALEQSEEWHRALVNNIHDAIALIDENQKIIYQTPSLARITGYEHSDRQNKSFDELIYHEDRPYAAQAYQKALLSPGEVIPLQFRIKNKNGDVIWVEGTGINLLHNDSVKAVVVNYRDITERKKYEEQQLLITSIVNFSDDAIISLDLNESITSWNNGAEKILGYSKDEMIGKSIRMIIPEEFQEEHRSILKDIESYAQSFNRYETQRIRKDGVIIDVSITNSPVFNSDGQITGVSKILRDITDRKKNFNLLQLQNKKLHEIANLQSHIVRQPLTSILGLIDLIDMKEPSNTSNFEVIPMLETASKELDNIIYQIVQSVNDINAMDA